MTPGGSRARPEKAQATASEWRSADRFRLQAGGRGKGKRAVEGNYVRPKSETICGFGDLDLDLLWLTTPRKPVNPKNRPIQNIHKYCLLRVSYGPSTQEREVTKSLQYPGRRPPAARWASQFEQLRELRVTGGVPITAESRWAFWQKGSGVGTEVMLP